MTFYQKTVGRQTPDIGRHSADDRPTVGSIGRLYRPKYRPIINVGLYMCYIVYDACIHITMKYIMHLFYLGIHFI